MKQIITLMLLAISFGAQSQIAPDLLSYYTFEGNVNDVSGNGYDATPFGVTYVTDRNGNPNSAVHFDGIDDYVNFPNLEALKTPLPVSFTFWVKYESADYQHQVLFNTSFENDRSTGVWFNSTSETGHYAVNFGDGQYNYTPDTRRTFVSDAVISINTWHHLAVVVTSATDMKIYVDKVLVPGTYSGNGGALQYSDTPGCLGRHDRNMSGPEDYFQGALDDAFYFSRALSQEDINTLYNANSELSVSQPQQVSETFYIYPNPASGELFFESASDAVKLLSIYNSFGQQVYSGVFRPRLDISNYASGLYYAKMSSGATVQTKKFIVK
ncbi:MAG TPA: LamG-like jellyroll fold domain-containing protein [Flavobacterium sp.]|nr:LamG-like jellyroll fold domain-containing protein [Flavobacterium sp.]